VIQPAAQIRHPGGQQPPAGNASNVHPVNPCAHSLHSGQQSETVQDRHAVRLQSQGGANLRHNVAVLIHPASEAESRQTAVIAGLDVLVREEALREGEDGYRLQSPQEKDWEKTRRSRELKTGDFNRLLREKHLPAMLRGLVAAAGAEFKRQFKVEVLYDDERILEGEVPLRIYEGGDDQVQRAVQRSRESAHENDVFLVLTRSEKTWRHAEEVFRSQEMIKDAEARSLQEGETELLHEERKRYERHVRDLERKLAEDLLNGTLIFRGNSEDLIGKDVRPALAATMATHLAEIYTRLDEWTAPVSKRDAVEILRADDLAGVPDYLRDSGLRVVKVEADGHKIDETGPVAQFLAAVKERVEYGSEPPGKYLENHFHRPPFGAELDVVMVVAAACVRAGLVRVAQGGSWLTSRTDARLEQVFGAVPKFRAAVFRTREDIDVNVRTRVAKLLHNDLVGEKTAGCSLPRGSAPPGRSMTTGQCPRRSSPGRHGTRHPNRPAVTSAEVKPPAADNIRPASVASHAIILANRSLCYRFRA
jgi:hypothetical protein